MSHAAEESCDGALPRQFSIARLLRIHAGIGGVLAIAVAAAHLHPHCHEGPIPPMPFAAATVAAALVAYFFFRHVFRRRIALLAAMAAAAIVADRFSRPKCDQMEVAALGMLVPLALFIGFGWLDQFSDASIAVSDSPSAHPTSDPPKVA